MKIATSNVASGEAKISICKIPESYINPWTCPHAYITLLAEIHKYTVKKKKHWTYKNDANMYT